MPAKPNYILKAGALIHPAGTSKFYTNPLPSDDIAEDLLSKFPGEINKFAHYPDDWESRVSAYKERKEKEDAQRLSAKADDETAAPVESEADTEIIESLKTQLEVARKEKSEVEERLSAAEEKLKLLEIDKANLGQQIDGLTSALANNLEVEDGETDKENDSEELAQLRIELETARTELEAARDEITGLKNDNRALKAANTRLKNNGAKDAE